MKKRKRIIVKRSFQYRLTLGITALLFVCLMAIFGLLLHTMQTNNAKMTRLLAQQEGLNDFQLEVMESLRVFQANRNWENLNLATGKASRDLEKNQQQIQENIALLRQVTARNQLLLWISGGVMLVMILCSIIWGIRRSHRIAGPIYLLERYLDEIIEGKYPDVRPLREGDEFKGLFSKFVVAVAALKEREEKMNKRAKKRDKRRQTAGV